METDQPQTQPKPVKDRAGHVYKNQTEKMKYYMRRKRGAPLPGYPDKEQAKGY